MNKRTTLRTLAVIVMLATAATLARAGGIESGDDATSSEPVVCGTTIMSRIDPATALANTARLNPELYRRMTSPRSTGPQPMMKPTLAIGDRKEFNVLNQVIGAYDQVTAVLVSIGKYSRIWVDTASKKVTSAMIAQMARALDTATSATSRNPQQGIIDNDVDVFGPMPLNGWTGDLTTEFLFTDIQDNLGGNAHILGFFYPLDQSESAPASNHANILYIDSKEGVQRGVNSLLSTVAHEFQHLLHNVRNPWSESLYNEGCSEDASILNGYMDRDNTQFMDNPNVDLFRWSGDATVTADYERAMTFTHYMQEQFGERFLYELVGETSQGIDRIDRTLDKLGIASSSSQVLEGFAIANVLRTHPTSPIYAYTTPIRVGGTPRMTRSYILPRSPNDTTFNLEGYAVNYLSLTNPSKLTQGLRLRFQADAPITVLAIIYRGTGIEVRRLGGSGMYAVNDAPFDRVIFTVVSGAPFAQSVRVTGELVPLGVAVDDAPADGITLALFPSPSAGPTSMRFALSQGSPVSISIFDGSGRNIRTLVNGERFEAGVHDVSFDGGDLPAGYYVARLVAGGRTLVSPMILTK